MRAAVARLAPLVKPVVRGAVQAACAGTPLARVITWRGRRDDRRVALTFDDGPVDGFTDEVLAILARHGARATFFVLGERVERHPDVVRRIAEGGHDVGVHGWDHSSAELPRQTVRTAAALGALGVTTRLFRPPRGRLDPRTLGWMVSRGWSTVMWSFDMLDSMRHEGKRAAAIDPRAIRGGDIVLWHDDNPVCTAELPVALDALARGGLAPVTVRALLAG